jgi:hypothetical protein
MIGVSMPELQPTPTVEWSEWETEPKLPGYWPGLGSEHRPDGFDIDRRGVKAVSGKLIDAVGRTYEYDYLVISGAGLEHIHWALLRDLNGVLTRADEALRGFWKDLHAEVGMAGLLLERVCTRYDLVDDPRLGDIPSARLDERILGASPGERYGDRLYSPSRLYPNGSESLELPGAVDYGVGNMTAAKGERDLGAGWSITEDWYQGMADSLIDLARTLEGRARDLRDSPWYGEAADKAQTALRQIYGNATALAAIAGQLDTAHIRVKEIVDWAGATFEKVAAPDRGAWDEFWDFDGTKDSRTREVLAQANNALLDVYRMMPKRIKEDLPGLLVTDTSLTELRDLADEARVYHWDSQWKHDEKREWRQHYLPILEGYEQAEKEYG